MIYFITFQAQDIGAESRGVADAGQADLGMDYAWLDDVTYVDWQYYHDLVRSALLQVLYYIDCTERSTTFHHTESDNHTRDLLSIADGTHTTPLANPILDAMKELKTEVEEIVTGFETRMRRLNRDGVRSFDGKTPESASASDKEEAPQPEVSILPIPGDAVEPGVKDTPPVVIGRGSQEVLEALGRVEAQEQTEALPSVKNDARKEPEEIISELAQEAEGEQAKETPVIAPRADL